MEEDNDDDDHDVDEDDDDPPLEVGLRDRFVPRSAFLFLFRTLSVPDLGVGSVRVHAIFLGLLRFRYRRPEIT